MNLRYQFLKASLPLTKALGKVGVHRRIKDNEYYAIDRDLYAGCVLLSRKRYELSNLFIPGKYTHAAIFNGHKIVEAVGEGIREVSLAYFCYDKDYIAIMEPNDISNTEIKDMCVDMQNYIGLKYDYYFDSKNKSYYCSELVYQLLTKNVASFREFEMRESLGVKTVTPDDFYKAKKYFNLIGEF